MKSDLIVGLNLLKPKIPDVHFLYLPTILKLLCRYKDDKLRFCFLLYIEFSGTFSNYGIYKICNMAWCFETWNSGFQRRHAG